MRTPASERPFHRRHSEKREGRTGPHLASETASPPAGRAELRPPPARVPGISGAVDRTALWRRYRPNAPASAVRASSIGGSAIVLVLRTVMDRLMYCHPLPSQGSTRGSATRRRGRAEWPPILGSMTGPGTTVQLRLRPAL